MQAGTKILLILVNLCLCESYSETLFSSFSLYYLLRASDEWFPEKNEKAYLVTKYYTIDEWNIKKQYGSTLLKKPDAIDCKFVEV